MTDRIFRVCCNPLDPFVIGGPGGDAVLIRLPFYIAVPQKMLYCTFHDGGYIRVPDADMGIVGPAFDSQTLGDSLGPVAPYLMFQESALPEGAGEEDIPLWSEHAVALIQPPTPMPEPHVWPVYTPL